MTFGFQAVSNYFNSIIDDVTAASFYAKRALSRPQFCSDFLEILVLSTLPEYLIWDCNSAFCVISFGSKWRLKNPLKPKVTWIWYQLIRCRFWLITTRWSWICTYAVHLIKNNQNNSQLTSAKSKMTTFLEWPLLQICSSKRIDTFHEQSIWHFGCKCLCIGSLA